MLLLVISGTGTAWIRAARMSRLTLQEDDGSNFTIKTQSSDENNQFVPDLSSAKSEREKYEDKTTSVEADFVKLTTATQIQVAAEQLCERKEKLEMIEAAAARSRISMAIIDPNTSERFSRAETVAERRMYRALAGLMVLWGKGPGNLLLKPKTPA